MLHTMANTTNHNKHSLNSATVLVRKIRRKSNISQIESEYNQVYTHIQGSPVEIPSSYTPELDRPQRNRLAASVIAQQYSSTTFFSLCFHSRND